MKRPSMPSYRYTELDLDHLGMMVAEDRDERVLGIVAWEAADDSETPAGLSGLLVRGLHVAPDCHHRGVGGLLDREAERAARRRERKGLLVKAQEDAIVFFVAQGMHRLEVRDPIRQFPYPYWKEI